MSSELAKFFPVSDQQYEDILKEFGKTKEDISEGVKIIREWLKKQPHIPVIKDDVFIARVLVRNKGRVEKTKTKIDSYFTSKNIYADYFSKCDPCSGEILHTSKYIFITYMPKLTPNNARVYFWMMRLSKDEDYNATAFMRYNGVLGEIQFLNDDCPSMVFVLDVKGFGMTHMLKMDLNIQSQTFKLLFDAFSGRISAMHVVNVSPAAEKAVNLMKLVFSAKLRDRIYFHSNFESLHKVVPKDCLPGEVGGTGPSGIELAGRLSEATQNDRDNVLERHKIATNESLRVGDPPIQLDMFGVDGTFKKIVLD